MVEQQSFILVGSPFGVNIVGNANMARFGSNGLPIFEYLEDGVVASHIGGIKYRFYIYAPTIHWHTI